MCRYISKGIISCIRSVEIRYVNGSFVVGTTASSPGVPRHMHVLYRTVLPINVLTIFKEEVKVFCEIDTIIWVKYDLRVLRLRRHTMGQLL